MVIEMRILHILNSSKFSGAENVAITIINNMKNDNEIIYVSPEGQIREHLQENNINYEPVRKVCIKEIKRVIKKYKPDIIHAHDFTASIISAIASNKKIKVISHIHINNPWMKKVNLKTIIYLLSTIKYKKILIVSKSIIDEYIFIKFINKKVEVIGNIVDTNRVKKMSEEIDIQEDYDIIFIGRLSEPKQPIKFIELINKLKISNKNIKVVMLGDGPLRTECEKEIEKYNLEENIELKGFQKNPYIYLNKSKILCMTSEWEGYGLVAVEALCLGKPVVATNVGGIPSIVNDKCGKVTNNFNEMLDEITNLLQDDNYYQNKQLSALERVKQINNMEKYISEMNKIYNN